VVVPDSGVAVSFGLLEKLLEFGVALHQNRKFLRHIMSLDGRLFRLMGVGNQTSSCGQLSQITAAARWMPPRKEEARLS
jgi:hypothetical protein